MRVHLAKCFNKEKTTLFFSKNIDEVTQDAFKLYIGVLAIQHYEKYLGLLSFVGRKKRLALLSLKNRFGMDCKAGRRSFSL